MSESILQAELSILLNNFCGEKASDTPDFILAKYLIDCLSAFSEATNKRDEWYGMNMRGKNETIKKETKMNIRPLQDRIIVKRIEEEEKTKGGIIIPDSAREKPMEGEVISVGVGKVLENGSKQAMEVKKGDRILFGKYSGTEVKIDGIEHLIIQEDDVLGIIEK